MRIFTLRIEIPALDRLVDWFQSKDQAKIEALEKQVQALIQSLDKSTTTLNTSVEQNKET